MRAILGQTIFSVGDSVFLWADVVLAAELRGEWRPVVERAKAELAALDREAASEEELVEDSEIEEESDRFRYEKNLVSIDDTEKWLGTWGLDVEALLTWIRADLLRKRFESEGAAAGPVESAEWDDETVEAAVQAEAAFSGALSRFARRLAAEAAIAQRLAEDPAPEDALRAEAADSTGFPSVDVGSLPPGFPAEGLLERARAFSRLGRVFDAFRSEVVTAEAVAARVRAHQGDWMRVDCRILTVPTEDVAREALLSIQEDGEEMSVVAAGAGAEVREGTFYLEELEQGISDHVLAARKGELLGPLRTEEGYALVEVLAKRLASVDDEEIRTRAEQSLFDSVVEREMDDRVLWRWGR